jgi:hypothetical protein
MIFFLVLIIALIAGAISWKEDQGSTGQNLNPYATPPIMVFFVTFFYGSLIALVIQAL